MSASFKWWVMWSLGVFNCLGVCAAAAICIFNPHRALIFIPLGLLSAVGAVSFLMYCKEHLYER